MLGTTSSEVIHYCKHVTSEVIIAAKIMSAGCNAIYRCLAYSSGLKTEAVSSSEASVNIYRNTRRYTHIRNISKTIHRRQFET
jgi:hypothetical protein